MKNIQILLFVSLAFLSLSTKSFAIADSNTTPIELIQSNVEITSEHAVKNTEESQRSLYSFFSDLALQIEHFFNAVEAEAVNHPEVIDALQNTIANDTDIAVATQNALLSDLEEVEEILADGQITAPEVAHFITHIFVTHN